MKIHGNAELSLNKRRTLAKRIVEQGWSPAKRPRPRRRSATRTARKWEGRYRAEGEAGLLDRPSTPKRVWNRTDERRTQVIAMLRRLRLTGPEIAEVLDMATSTVSAVLKRIGLGKLSRLEPPEPPNRYQCSRPGELLHIDVKKLGRISERGAGHRVTGNRASQFKRRNKGPSRGVTGWEFVHVCVDDATRLAFVEVLANERATTAIAFLRRCLHHYRSFRDHGRAGDERQRLRLRLGGLRDRLPRAGDQALQDEALPTKDEWEGGAISPHHAGRVGIRRGLWVLRGSRRRRSLRLARAIQHQQTTRRPRSPTADSAAAGADREQRGWYLQLGEQTSVKRRAGDPSATCVYPLDKKWGLRRAQWEVSMREHRRVAPGSPTPRSCSPRPPPCCSR